MIDGVTFRDASLDDVVKELRIPGRTRHSIRDRLNIVVLPNAGKGHRFSGHWDAVKCVDLFGEIAKQGEMTVRVDTYAVVLGPRGKVLPRDEAAKHSGGEPPRKFAKTVIQIVEFRDSTLPQIVEFLDRKLKESAGPGERVELLVRCDRLDDLPAVTMSLSNVPAEEVIRYVAEYTGMRVQWNDRSVVLKCRK
jgi:hypothetical protein